MYLEQYEIGKSYSTGSICVHESMIYDFSLKYDSQPFHLNPQHPRAQEMGGLFASGYHSLAIGLRLAIESGFFAHTIIGLGMDKVRWHLPVMSGMVVTAENTVLSARPSQSKPDRGVMSFAQCLVNTANADTLMTCEVTMMVARNPHTLGT